MIPVTPLKALSKPVPVPPPGTWGEQGTDAFGYRCHCCRAQEGDSVSSQGRPWVVETTEAFVLKWALTPPPGGAGVESEQGSRNPATLHILLAAPWCPAGAVGSWVENRQTPARLPRDIFKCTFVPWDQASAVPVESDPCSVAASLGSQHPPCPFTSVPAP